MCNVCKVCERQIQANTQSRLITYLSEYIGKFGSGGWDRTNDQLINSQLLYR